MIRKCSVCGMKKKKNLHGGNVILHGFPADENDRRIWCEAIQKDITNFRSASVCSYHFLESDYILTANGRCTFKRLRKDAVPSVFDDYLHCGNPRDHKKREMVIIYYLDESNNVCTIQSSVATSDDELEDESENAYKPNSDNKLRNDYEYKDFDDNAKRRRIGYNTSSENEEDKPNFMNSNTSTGIKSLPSFKRLEQNIEDIGENSINITKITGLSRSDFTSASAWESFCNTVSEDTEYIEDLKYENTALEKQIKYLTNIFADSAAK